MAPPNTMDANAHSLTAAAFERLLATLDADRERAGLAYENLRERISGLFGWWGATNADELADETIDRVARKLEQGASVPPGSIGAYVRGVARMVFYESTRNQTRQLESIDLAAPITVAAIENDAALHCLDQCLSRFDPEQRDVLLRYYDGNSRARTRQRIAADMNISITALRIRMHRLRDRLETCVTGCLRRS